MSFDRFDVTAKLIITSSRSLTKEERMKAAVLVEQYLNSLPMFFLDDLHIRAGIRVHVGPITKKQQEKD